MKEKIKRYFWNILVWVTQSINVFTGGNPDQSFSGRVGVAYLRGKKWAKPFRIVIDKLFNMINRQEEHCIESIEWDRVEQRIINEIKGKEINLNG